MASSSLGAPRGKYLHSFGFYPHTFVSASSLSVFVICCILLFFIFTSPPSLYGSFPLLKHSPQNHFIRPDHGSNRGNRKSCTVLSSNLCNYQEGNWIYDDTRKPIYNEDCPFQRNAWNSDEGTRRWKRKGAWKGAYFPKFNVTVGYHRAVLLAKYEWQPATLGRHSAHQGLKGTYRLDVDIPADDWINATNYYDVYIFNTGHWWGPDKFPKETPLVFYRGGKPISPPLGITDGLHVVLQSMVSYIERTIPKEALKIWRTQSPRHFDGGEWNQNGSCTFDSLLEESKLDDWFDPENGGVNREAREVNAIIKRPLQGTSIHLLDLTHLSEFRADAHPAIWLGRKDAVSIWGQDCMHWCLPGLPDTWVDVLSAVIMGHLNAKARCLSSADK